MKNRRDEMGGVKKFAENVIPFWRSGVIILTPILASPLLAHSQESRCAFVLVNMAAFWVSEALPIPVTSLIPVVGFPLLGILSTEEVSVLYMKSTNMLFLGGLIVAISIEHCNLHKRIALFVILHVGQSPRRLMAGFMITTMFLSMWISNTATTAMMIPIIDAIVEELFENMENSPPNENKHSNIRNEDLTEMPGLQNEIGSFPDDPTPSVNIEGQTREQRKKDIRNMCLLGVAYSANVGGTGSLTGTGPNIVMKGLMDSSFNEPTSLNFTTWIAFNVPGMLICVFLEWIWLQIFYLGFGVKNQMIDTSKESLRSIRNMIKKKYNELGRISFHEWVVLFFFVFLVLLWLLREPGFFTGWSYIFEYIYGEDYRRIDNGTSAIFVVVLLFMIPRELNFWPFHKSSASGQSKKASQGCLTWEILHEKVPWGIVILVGSGFAMAEGSKVSGLSSWLGKQLLALDFMPLPVMCFVITLAISFITEITSNIAISSIFLPVLLDLSLSLRINPIYLMMASAVTCSYAFMLPVATAPNAIALEAARMTIPEMMKVGFMMNIICVIVINVMINTYGRVIFDLDSMPAWTNSTTLNPL